MKVSKLLSGLEDPLSQDLILKNALEEIDRLEEEVASLEDALQGADMLISEICKKAVISYSEVLKKNRLYISVSFTEGTPEYVLLKLALDLDEPDAEEKKEEE